MSNKIQIKRTSVAGRIANTTTLPNAGELALNMTDRIMYSTNGSEIFEIGANTTNSNISNTLTVSKISANNELGISGYNLKSSGDSTYWYPDTETSTIYTTIGTASQVFDSYSDEITTCKAVIEMSRGSNTHSAEFLITVSGTDVNISEYGTVYSENLGTITASRDTENVLLSVTPIGSNVQIKSHRINLGSDFSNHNITLKAQANGASWNADFVRGYYSEDGKRSNLQLMVTESRTGNVYFGSSNGLIYNFTANEPARTDDGLCAIGYAVPYINFSEEYYNWTLQNNCGMLHDSALGADQTMTAVTLTNGSGSSSSGAFVTIGSLTENTVKAVVRLKAGTAANCRIGIYNSAFINQTGKTLKGPGTISGTQLQYVSNLSSSTWSEFEVRTDAAQTGPIRFYIYPETTGTATGKSVLIDYVQATIIPSQVIINPDIRTNGSYTNRPSCELYTTTSLGSEVININGTWAFDTGFSVSSSTLYLVDAALNTSARQSSTLLENGATYTVTYSLIITSGSVRPILYGNGKHKTGTIRTTNGTYTENLTITDTGGSYSDLVAFQSQTVDTNAQIFAISIKQIKPFKGYISGEQTGTITFKPPTIEAKSALVSWIKDSTNYIELYANPDGYIYLSSTVGGSTAGFRRCAFTNDGSEQTVRYHFDPSSGTININVKNGQSNTGTGLTLPDNSYKISIGHSNQNYFSQSVIKHFAVTSGNKYSEWSSV